MEQIVFQHDVSQTIKTSARHAGRAAIAAHLIPTKNAVSTARPLEPINPLGLTATEGAKVLSVARHTLSRVLNGQAGLSPETAIRLSKAGWSNADHWVRLQTAYDLAQAREHQDEINLNGSAVWPCRTLVSDQYAICR